MADKLAPIIIKKITVSGHGHHGGAWKVAYADFVTAMMAFFMVMWLMGSDEETKEAISHYFNHPNTPFKAGMDPISKAIHPMGERTGEGDTVLAGLQGQTPDDLVTQPVRAESYVEKFREMADLLHEVLDGKTTDIEVEVDYLKFSIPEGILFAAGTSKLKGLNPKDPLRQGAGKYLSRIARVFANFKGFVAIEGHATDLQVDGRQVSSLYEASIIKAVAVRNFLTEHNLLNEDRVRPVSSGQTASERQGATPGDHPPVASIEFTLTRGKRN